MNLVLNKQLLLMLKFLYLTSYLAYGPLVALLLVIKLSHHILQLHLESRDFVLVLRLELYADSLHLEVWIFIYFIPE